MKKLFRPELLVIVLWKALKCFFREFLKILRLCGKMNKIKGTLTTTKYFCVIYLEVFEEKMSENVE